MRGLSVFTLLIMLASLTACGGGGGSGSFTPGGSNGGTGSTGGTGSNGGTGNQPSGPNVAPMVVDAGPTGTNFAATNTPYVSVTICAPGTSNCQTIDHIEVDTGSYGLRIISSVINTTLLTAMPTESAGGGSIAECTIFGDGYSWGSMRTADVQIASEKASGVPVQIIGDPNFPTVPADCQSSGGTAENTVDQFGAKGILGVGPFAQDCGTACVSGTTTPQFYYSCPSGGATCTATPVVLTQQATNPVVKFTTDNNGVILELPSIADSGAAMATGALIFGIDTQSNNMLSGATVLTTDPQTGYITTVYKGTSLPDSYIDSGSNLYYFNDSSIATCALGGGTNNTFFCPATELTLTAQNEGKNNSPSTVTFKVANAQTLFTNNASFTAFSNIAAPPFASATQSQTFDFGLPFFFGRSVFTAIEGMNTSGGMGPFFAY